MVVAAAVEAPNSHHHTVAADTAVDTAAAAVAVAGSIRLVAAGVGVIADIPGCPKLLLDHHSIICRKMNEVQYANKGKGKPASAICSIFQAIDVFFEERSRRNRRRTYGHTLAAVAEASYSSCSSTTS